MCARASALLHLLYANLANTQHFKYILFRRSVHGFDLALASAHLFNFSMILWTDSAIGRLNSVCRLNKLNRHAFGCPLYHLSVCYKYGKFNFKCIASGSRLTRLSCASDCDVDAWHCMALHAQMRQSDVQYVTLLIYFIRTDLQRVTHTSASIPICLHF